MEKEHTLHEVVQGTAETYRRNPDIVGLWSLLDPHEPETEYLVIQNKDQSAELIIFKPGSAPFLSDGKIIHERMESGHPISQTFFISNFDQRRIILESHEF